MIDDAMQVLGVHAAAGIHTQREPGVSQRGYPGIAQGQPPVGWNSPNGSTSGMGYPGMVGAPPSMVSKF